MTRTEHLLTILAEECAEVAQRASKALRFGVAEVQDGQTLTNSERIVEEMHDVLAVYDMVREEPDFTGGGDLVERLRAIRAKQHKVEHFLRYSAKCGTMERCRHGVAGADCFNCFPQHKEKTNGE